MASMSILPSMGFPLIRAGRPFAISFVISLSFSGPIIISTVPMAANISAIIITST